MRIRLNLARHLAALSAALFIGVLSTQVCQADLWGLSTPANGTPASGEENNYNKVFRFDEQGNKLANDIPTSAGAGFPTGIAVSPSGNIYVSSGAYGSILYFDGQTGSPLSPLEGATPGLFTTLFNDPLEGDPNPAAAPAQLAFGPDGNLYVSEYFGDRVRVYDPVTGTRLPDAATGLTSANGLGFAANGDLLVGDGFAMAENQVAQIIRVHNGVQSTWGTTGLGYFYAPTAMLTQANGDVLVVDMLANLVWRVPDSGIVEAVPFASIPPTPVPPPTNYPSGIKFDPNGNIVISTLGATNPPDDAGTLLRYDLSGNLIETIESGLEPIAGIDYTPDPATLLGDYDGDDSAGQPGDYAKWRADFGKLVARGNGADGNSDGVIDAADYVVWRNAVPGDGAYSPSTSVPEPGTTTMLVSALISIMAGTTRRRRCTCVRH